MRKLLKTGHAIFYFIKMYGALSQKELGRKLALINKRYDLIENEKTYGYNINSVKGYLKKGYIYQCKIKNKNEKRQNGWKLTKEGEDFIKEYNILNSDYVKEFSRIEIINKLRKL